MSSSKQIAANRRNAAKSTGPRTLEGKRRVSSNAVQHGFYAAKFIIPGESREEFQSICAEFMNEHRPVGPVESSLVQQLALAHWRIMRFHALLAAAFERHTEELAAAGQDSDAGRAFAADLKGSREILHLDRIVNSAERSFIRTLKNLTALQKSVVDPTPPFEDTIAIPSNEPSPGRLPGADFDPRRSSMPLEEDMQNWTEQSHFEPPHAPRHPLETAHSRSRPAKL